MVAVVAPLTNAQVIQCVPTVSSAPAAAAAKNIWAMPKNSRNHPQISLCRAACFTVVEAQIKAQLTEAKFTAGRLN